MFARPQGSVEGQRGSEAVGYLGQELVRLQTPPRPGLAEHVQWELLDNFGGVWGRVVGIELVASTMRENVRHVVGRTQDLFRVDVVEVPEIFRKDEKVQRALVDELQESNVVAPGVLDREDQLDPALFGL